MAVSKRVEYIYKKYIEIMMNEVYDCEYPVEFAQNLRNMFILSNNIFPEVVYKLLKKQDLPKKKKRVKIRIVP